VRDTKQYKKEYYQKNKEAIKIKAKEYCQRPETIQLKKELRLRNFDKRKKYEKERYARIKFEKKEYLKVYRKENYIKLSKQCVEYKKKRRERDIKFKIQHNLHTLLRMVLKIHTKEGKKMISKKYGIDWEPIINKLIETKPTDFNYRKYNTDHIIPCASFNLEDPEQVKKCFCAENIQWLPAEDNFNKKAKIDWVKIILPPILTNEVDN
jgi:hypothetical protein